MIVIESDLLSYWRICIDTRPPRFSDYKLGEKHQDKRGKKDDRV